MLNIPSSGELIEEEIWRGRIRLHESVHSYISEIEELEDSLTLLTIRDNRFRFVSSQHSQDYPTRPSASAQNERYLPAIFVWLRGEKLESLMDCSAVYGRRTVKKGLLGKEEAVSAKGFTLSPAAKQESSSNTMFGLRIQGTPDRDFKVESMGIVSFCVSSQVQSLDSMTRGTSSRTYIVISSNEQPFIAYTRRSHGIKKLICDSESIKETSVEPQNKVPIGDSEEEAGDLFQLKLRLLKGEITRAEFEMKRSKLESA